MDTWKEKLCSEAEEQFLELAKLGLKKSKMIRIVCGRHHYLACGRRTSKEFITAVYWINRTFENLVASQDSSSTSLVRQWKGCGRRSDEQT